MGQSMENKATLKKVLNIVFYVVLAIVFIYAIFGLFSKKDSNSISFLGITSMAVQSDSMLPEFAEGDLIFVKTDFNAKELVEGDVITYQDFMITEDGVVTYYNTHRIIDVDDTNEVWRFVTKGDNNLTQDPRQILETEIYGVWTEKSWTGFGKFADSITDFLKSSLGFFLFIVVPCLALLVYEVIKFMKVYAAYNVQKNTQDRVKMQEEALAAAKAQLEAEAVTKAEKDNKDQQK
jgi:signal peptidase I